MRAALPILCLSFAAGCAHANAPAPAATPAPAGDRPNIVFIMADDLGWGEVGCYGQKKIRTPHIDQLAKEGLRFTRSYSGAPVCAPSRCVLMTGLHLGHAPIRGNLEHGEEGEIPLPAGYATWASALKQAGYMSCGIGKWGLGMPDNEGSPMKHGFFHFYGFMCQRQAHSYYPSHLWSDNTKIMLDNGPKGVSPYGQIKGAPTPADFAKFQGKDYAPDHFMAEAKAWLNARAKDGKPFALYLPFTEPHVAMQPPQRLVDTYPQAWDTKPYLGEKAYCPYPRPHAGYAAMITSLDEHVGQVMGWLKENGMDKNTVVVFTSDNGATHDVGGVDTAFFNSEGGLRGRKGSCYEGGVRMPFIVRWPGHAPAGAVSDEIVAFPDMLPTLCDLTGATPVKCDGVSLRAVFEGKQLANEHPPVVYDYPEYGGQQAIIMGKWKLIRVNLQKKMTPWQLYDLQADIGETTDVAAQHPDLAAQLAARFARERTLPIKEFRMKAVDGAPPAQ